MGYRVEYGTGNHDAIFQKTGSRKVKLFATAVTVGVLLLAGFWNRERVIDFLLPGDPAVTKRAIGVFVAELQRGERATDAFVSFCEVIVNEAEIS